LGLDAAAVLPLESRYVLASDAQSVTDKHTGHTYGAAEFARALFDTKEDEMFTTLQRRLARDADLPSKAGIAGSPKTMINDQDPSGTASPPSGEELLSFIQLCMQGLDPDELNTFLSGLSALISHGAGAPMGAGDQGAPANNKGALDRRRAGARDSKRAAMDGAVRAMNSASFGKRFPFLDRVSVR
jgi:hypothetical protein